MRLVHLPMAIMGFGYEKHVKIGGEGKKRKIDTIDKSERTRGRNWRETRGGSVIDMRGRRGGSVTGLKGRIAARGESGRRGGKGKSERTGVRGRMRGFDRGILDKEYYGR